MRNAILGLLSLFLSPLGFSAEPTPSPIATAPLLAAPAAKPTTVARWSEEVAALEGRQVTVSHSNGIVFLGSSSIRRWKTLSDDFEGLSCVNCGFGGSWLADSVTYFQKLVVPWHPSTIVVYAGENDLEDGHTPDQVAKDFDALCNEAHAALPKTKIIMVSIKPSPARWNLRPAIEQTNKLLAARCATDSLCRFVDIYSLMMEADKPRAELFGPDRLHMNAAGYKLWTQILNGLLRPTNPGIATASVAATTASTALATTTARATAKAATPPSAAAHAPSGL